MKVNIQETEIPAGGGCKKFWISTYPITVGEWNAMMEMDPRTGRDEYPVTCVSIDDIKKFLTNLNLAASKAYRLPTEVEWCWAAGREPEVLKDYAVFNQREICSVGTKLPNEYGVYDMRGLVWEWMTTGRLNKRYVLRGGSFVYYHDFARAVSRSSLPPAFRGSDFGFRVVRDWEMEK